MTNAPQDLLTLRGKIQTYTGLTAVSVGIVGDSAHAATGGYHEGKTDLINAGVFGSDYSVRLTRDRNGCTESASAMDIGYQWPHGGNAAWLRFNGWLAGELRTNRSELAAIRAINYSPDGHTKLRIDRQNNWATETSSDSVDVHTHIEWYRDTEGNRLACLNRLAVLVFSAVSNQNPEDPDMAFAAEDHDHLVNIDQTVNALIRLDEQAKLTTGNQANNLAAVLTDIHEAVTALGAEGVTMNITQDMVNEALAANIEAFAAAIVRHQAAAVANTPGGS